MRCRSSSCAVTSRCSRLVTAVFAAWCSRTSPTSSSVRRPTRASSSSFAVCSASAASRWLVRSRAIFANPRPPAPSRRIMPLQYKRVPSLRRWYRSSAARPLRLASASSRRWTPAARSSDVKRTSLLTPTISSAAYPNIRCAPAFHESITPSSVVVKIA